MTTPAFVLGNGRSRLNINPENLKKHGTVYACNAAYRDFTPDYLIAVDMKMLLELDENRVYEKTKIYTNPNRRFKDNPNFNVFENGRGWSSGPTALWFASQQGHQEIYILGFDYAGIDGLLNNVYADSKNYKKSTDKATFYGNWQRQTEVTAKNFKNVKYIRVINNEQYVPPWTDLKNFYHITFDQFKNMFNV